MADQLLNAPQFVKGVQVYVSASFTNASGSLVDPTGVVFKWKLKNGSTTTLTYGVDAALVKDATGVYHVTFTPSSAGIHYIQWTTTGTTLVGAWESTIVITESNF